MTLSKNDVSPELAAMLLAAAGYAGHRPSARGERDAVRLARLWKVTSPAGRIICLGSDTICHCGTVRYRGEMIPIITANQWILRAVELLGETVQDLPFQGLAPGQTVRPAWHAPAPRGKGSVEVSSQELITRAKDIIMASGNDPERLLPYSRGAVKSRHAQTFSALVSSCNRWGHFLPAVTHLSNLRPFAGSPKKLGRAFFEDLLPSPANSRTNAGWSQLQPLLAAVERADALVNPDPKANFVSLYPFPASALAWPCYAMDPKDRLSAPPMWLWLQASAGKHQTDNNGLSTAGVDEVRSDYSPLYYIRPREGTYDRGDKKNVERRVEWEKTTGLSYAYYMTYMALAARLVNKWISASIDTLGGARPPSP